MWPKSPKFLGRTLSIQFYWNRKVIKLLLISAPGMTTSWTLQLKVSWILGVTGWLNSRADKQAGLERVNRPAGSGSSQRDQAQARPPSSEDPGLWGLSRAPGRGGANRAAATVPESSPQPRGRRPAAHRLTWTCPPHSRRWWGSSEWSARPRPSCVHSARTQPPSPSAFPSGGEDGLRMRTSVATASLSHRMFGRRGHRPPGSAQRQLCVCALPGAQAFSGRLLRCAGADEQGCV